MGGRLQLCVWGKTTVTKWQWRRLTENLTEFCYARGQVDIWLICDKKSHLSHHPQNWEQLYHWFGGLLTGHDENSPIEKAPFIFKSVWEGLQSGPNNSTRKPTTHRAYALTMPICGLLTWTSWNQGWAQPCLRALRESGVLWIHPVVEVDKLERERYSLTIMSPSW